MQVAASSIVAYFCSHKQILFYRNFYEYNGAKHMCKWYLHILQSLIYVVSAILDLYANTNQGPKLICHATFFKLTRKWLCWPIRFKDDVCVEMPGVLQRTMNNYALWKKFSKCVKFGTKSTHFYHFFFKVRCHNGFTTT